MSKLTLSDVANLQNEETVVSTLATNNAATEAALENTLSRDGTNPNAMLSALDMNSNQIINLPAPVAGQSPLRLQDYNTLLSGGTINVSNTIGIDYVIDGGGAQISLGKHGLLQIPFPALITQVNLLADQTGSVVLDIWKCSYADYNPPTHPAVGDTITAASLPTISSGVRYQDSTLTGWTTTINAGDAIIFNINSISNITSLTVCLTITKT